LKMGSSYHQPVMPEEVIHYLKCEPGGVYVDGTVGGGGHAREILIKTAPGGRLIGIDRDDDALAESEHTLKSFVGRVALVKGNFADLTEILSELGIEQVDGILLDLGLSSHQVDTAERGFSFMSDAPLDMRMDQSHGLAAYDLVNTLSEKELKRIFREYGEEMMAGRIARAIVKKREASPIEKTRELAGIILSALPPSQRRMRIHPATKTFQALRIAVNDELTNLHRAIREGMGFLKEGGRFVIISFHSLEDRIVKNQFRSWEKGCICPPDFPFCTCGRKPQLKILTRKPALPGPEEIAANPRARSARLRAAVRI
jgi:16S rRNA (cytosine1402-N4)-methyltransferase